MVEVTDKAVGVSKGIAVGHDGLGTGGEGGWGRREKAVWGDDGDVV